MAAVGWHCIIALFQSFDCWRVPGPLGVAQGYNMAPFQGLASGRCPAPTGRYAIAQGPALGMPSLEHHIAL